MGRHSCCLKQKLRKGLWSPEEDEKLYNYMTRYGTNGCWSSVPKLAGLQRCGKSCRLRWLNYLRPDLKRGTFSQEEEDLIINFHKLLGNRWAQIAAQLPGRTDNEIKNFWNSCLKKKLMKQGIDPVTHKPLIGEALVKTENSFSEEESQQEQLPRSSKGLFHTTPSSLRPHEPAFLLSDAYSGTDGLVGASRETANRSVFDSLPFFEFQSCAGYNQNVMSQYQADLRPPVVIQDQFDMHPSFDFSSLPCLTSFDSGTSTLEFSANSGSRSMSSLLFNEAKECSSNNTVENVAFDCLFQFQEVKSEDLKMESWQEEKLIHSQNSISFSSYPLTSLSEDLTRTSFDVFDDIE